MPNALSGAASIGTPVLPPATAEWTLGEDGKSTVSTILGGKAVIIRKFPKTDASSGLMGEWDLPHTDEATEGKRYGLVTNLGDCGSVAVAQKAFELRIREHVSKSNADLHSELVAAETSATNEETAASDPF